MRLIEEINHHSGLLRRYAPRNEIFILLLILTFLLQPALAYSTSDGTIIINKQRPKRKAILDYKFVIMQSGDGKAYTNKQAFNNDNQGLTTMSAAPKAAPITKPTRSSVSGKAPSPRNETWDDYAEEVEMDESLGVSARIRQ